MPKVSKDTAAHVEDAGVMIGHYGELDGYTVGFEHFRERADATPLFKGLPDDRCQSPHWGYVVAGRITLRYADREEVYESGDAYYAPPGHTPLIADGKVIRATAASQVIVYGLSPGRGGLRQGAAPATVALCYSIDEKHANYGGAECVRDDHEVARGEG